MRQARDRERKCLRRKTEAGRFKRRLEYQAARAKRRGDRVASRRHDGGADLSAVGYEAGALRVRSFSIGAMATGP